MKSAISHVTALALSFLLFTTPVWATCGGGGGGGMGGMRSGGGSGPGADTQTYMVPWKILQPKDPAPSAGLIVYWFPASQQEWQNSSLRISRALSLYASQCVTMGVADAGTSLHDKLPPDAQLPIVLLAEPSGAVVGKLERNGDGKLKVGDVEKLVESEVKRREEKLKSQLKEAKEMAKGGDKDGAVPLLKSVVEQKCMFPSQAKDAGKELKKLGVDVAAVPDAPNFSPALTSNIEKTMARGLAAEDAAHYLEAERFYTAAHKLDPADPTPLRYLGELYRHHIGDWQRAREVFNAILAMPADPLSRAVALHGLGKMTIHEGDFKAGLHLMEASTREFPLALAYRNLAVYWNSEGDIAKANEYTEQALKLDPTDPFNRIFAAAFMAQNGRGDEALKIARENDGVLPASYNLAAIYAQAGQKEKALALLKRHFFEYERYQAVRSKEMMEARVDAVFASLRQDSDFLALTNDADGRLPMPPVKGMTSPAPTMNK